MKSTLILTFSPMWTKMICSFPAYATWTGEFSIRLFNHFCIPIAFSESNTDSAVAFFMSIPFSSGWELRVTDSTRPHSNNAPSLEKFRVRIGGTLTSPWNFSTCAQIQAQLKFDMFNLRKSTPMYANRLILFSLASASRIEFSSLCFYLGKITSRSSPDLRPLATIEISSAPTKIPPPNRRTPLQTRPYMVRKSSVEFRSVIQLTSEWNHGVAIHPSWPYLNHTGHVSFIPFQHTQSASQFSTFSRVWRKSPAEVRSVIQITSE
jgi:hypothetical protein